MGRNRLVQCLSAVAFMGGLFALSSGAANAATVQIKSIAATGLESEPGRTFTLMRMPAINDAGDVAFSAVDVGNDPLRAGIFRTRNQQFEPVALEGEPDKAGNPVPGFVQPVQDFNNNGDVVFGTLILDNPDEVVVTKYRRTDSGLELLGQELDPGRLPGSEVVTFGPGSLSEDGSVLYTVGIGERTERLASRIDATDIVRFDDSGPTIVVEDGSPHAGGETYRGPEAAAQNRNGDVVFNAFAFSDTGFAERIVKIDDEGVHNILKVGDTLAGGEEVTSVRKRKNIDINNNGQILSAIGVGPAQTTTLARIGPDGIDLIVAEGSAAPGTGDTFADFDKLSISENGQVVFGARLTNSNVPSFRSDGIFATDLLGNLINIVSVGQFFEVAPGDEREIVALDLVAGAAINASGLIAFYAEFAGQGMGIFTAQIFDDAVSQVPVPAALPLMTTVLMALGLMARRRSRMAV